MRFTLLRAFVALALLANIAYAAWQAGWLKVVGLAPATQRDPARLERQVRPLAVRVLPPAAAASAIAQAASAAAVGPPAPTETAPTAPGSTAMPAPGDATVSESPPPAASASETTAGRSGADAAGFTCLDIGPLEDGEAVAVAERALGAIVPTRAWVREARPAPAQYTVFIPILSRESSRQWREELTRLKISFEAIELPGGTEGGYSLGLHDSQASAAAALDGLRSRGLRSGRVALARPAGRNRTWLHAERLDAAQVQAVRALPPAALAGAQAGECLVGSVMSVTPPRR